MARTHYVESVRGSVDDDDNGAHDAGGADVARISISAAQPSTESIGFLAKHALGQSLYPYENAREIGAGSNPQVLVDRGLLYTANLGETGKPFERSDR